jgi:hypothetical protein
VKRGNGAPLKICVDTTVEILRKETHEEAAVPAGGGGGGGDSSAKAREWSAYRHARWVLSQLAVLLRYLGT